MLNANQYQKNTCEHWSN